MDRVVCRNSWARFAEPSGLLLSPHRFLHRGKRKAALRVAFGIEIAHSIEIRQWDAHLRSELQRTQSSRIIRQGAVYLVSFNRGDGQPEEFGDVLVADWRLDGKVFSGARLERGQKLLPLFSGLG